MFETIKAFSATEERQHNRSGTHIVDHPGETPPEEYTKRIRGLGIVVLSAEQDPRERDDRIRLGAAWGRSQRPGDSREEQPSPGQLRSSARMAG